MTDIENEAHRYHATHQDGEQQGQSVLVALSPQGPELQTAVLLHHHGAQERRYQYDGQHTRDGVGIPVQFPSRQQLSHKGQHEGKHDGDAGRAKDGIHHRVDGHLRQHLLPFAGLRGVRMTHAHMVQQLDHSLG